MSKVICRAVKVVTDNNGEKTGYVLMDEQGKTMSVNSTNIKAVLRADQAYISNLKLTSDGRLILRERDYIPAKVTHIANVITENTNIEHGVASVVNMRIKIDFLNTPYSLGSRLNGSDVFIHDNNTNTSISINNADDLKAITVKIAEFAKKDAAETKTNDSSNTIYVKISDINKAKKSHIIDRISAIAEHTSTSITITIDNKDADLVIDFDEASDYMEIIIDKTRVRSLRLIGGTVITHIVKNSIFNDVYTELSVILKNNIIFGTLENAVHGVEFIGVNVVGKAYFHNMISVTFNKKGTKVTKVTVGRGKHRQEVDQLEEVDNFSKRNSNIFIADEVICEEINSVNIFGKGFKANKINISSKRGVWLSMGLNPHAEININAPDVYAHIEDVIDNDTQRTINEVMGIGLEIPYRDSLIDTRDIIQNKFGNTSEKETVININGKLVNHGIKINAVINSQSNDSIRKVFTDKAKFKYNELTVFTNASILGNYIEKLLFIRGIVLTDKTDLTINDIIIGVDNEYTSPTSSTPVETLERLNWGFLLAKGATNFKLTIKNSIEPLNKTARYNYLGILKQLKEVSLISPIRVYWGTQAYSVLNSNGIAIEIVNKEDIPQGTQETAAVEQLTGVNYIDLINMEMHEAMENKVDTLDKESIAVSLYQKLPYDAIKMLNIENKVESDNTTEPRVARAIELFKMLPLCTLPFHEMIIGRLNDIKYRTKVYRMLESGNIVISAMNIAHVDLKGVDKYIIITNGDRLVHMVYLGSTYTRCSYGITVHAKEIFSQLHKIDKIDIKNKLVKQSITSSNINTDDFYKTLRDFFESVSAYIIYNNTLVTLGNSNEIVAFKVNASTKDYVYWDALHTLKEIEHIDSIESVKYDEKIIDDICNGINKELEESIIVNDMVNRPDLKTNGDNNEIPEQEVSIIHQMALRHDNYNCVTAAMLADFEKLGFIKEVSEKLYNKLTTGPNPPTILVGEGAADFYYRTYEVSSKNKEGLNILIDHIDYIHKVRFNDETIKYYTSQQTLNNLRGFFNGIKRGYESPAEPFEIVLEKYYKMYRVLKDDNKLPERDTRHILDAIDDVWDGINIDSSYIERLLNKHSVNGVPNYETILQEIPNTIGAVRLEQLIANVEFHKAYRNVKYSTIYSRGLVVGYRQIGRRKEPVNIHLEVVIDNKTGYLYALSGPSYYSLKVPCMRLKSFKEALTIKEQYKADMSNNKVGHNNLITKFTYDSDNKLVYITTENQCRNINAVSRYSEEVLPFISQKPNSIIYEK